MFFQLEHFQSDNFSELVDDSVGFVVPCRKGGYIVGLGRSLSHVDWDSRKITELHEVDKETKNRFNDGKCDPRGRVWAGKYLILYPASRKIGEGDIIAANDCKKSYLDRKNNPHVSMKSHGSQHKIY